MKPRARLITMAWGRPYVDTLLSLVLPAVLAPRNLPSLAEALECELVILTEPKFFDDISKSTVGERLRPYCSLRLMPLDDLIAPKGRYGMTLTYTLHRGFADLGPAMIDHYLIFFNADFILADGSFATLRHRILAGEQLIHAPSYCVIRERVERTLRDRVDRQTGTLSVSPRDLAAMILAHRHYTIRGKTINQRVFHSAYIDQFYWQADDHTLLGRQLPVALVCVKPERAVTEMRTFWDYGVVSELCPTVKPCVLGDSDEFLMLELRTSDTALDQMALGWPSTEKIAETLAKFVTEDQKKMGRYPLVLHAKNLPPTMQLEQDCLNEYVQSVYRLMPARAIPHLNHPFWLQHHKRFHAERQEYLDGGTPSSHSVGESNSSGHHSPSPPVETDRETPRRRRGVLAWLRSRLVGQVPFVRKFHPYYTILTPTYALIEQRLSKAPHRILLVADHDGPLSKFVRSLSARGHLVDEAAGLMQAEALAALPHVNRCGPFDLLIGELSFEGLLGFSRVFHRVSSLMARPGHVIVFHCDIQIGYLHANSAELIRQAVVPVGRSGILFAGTGWVKNALRLLQRSDRVRARYGRLGFPICLGLSASALGCAIVANVVTRTGAQNAVTPGSLSVTLEYELPPLPLK